MKGLHGKPFTAAAIIFSAEHFRTIGLLARRNCKRICRARQRDLRVGGGDGEPRTPPQLADARGQGADSGGGVAIARLAALPAKANQTNEMRILRFAFSHPPSPSPGADKGRTTRSTVMW